jgi:hypothetical protein
VRPAALHHRVARLEAAAEQAATPSVGVLVVAILDGMAPGPRTPDEVLLQTRVGRLLLARRTRAGIGYRD